MPSGAILRIYLKLWQGRVNNVLFVFHTVAAHKSHCFNEKKQHLSRLHAPKYRVRVYFFLSRRKQNAYFHIPPRLRFFVLKQNYTKSKQVIFFKRSPTT